MGQYYEMLMLSQQDTNFRTALENPGMARPYGGKRIGDDNRKTERHVHKLACKLEVQPSNSPNPLTKSVSGTIEVAS
jgi:hypothetical protein